MRLRYGWWIIGSTVAAASVLLAAQAPAFGADGTSGAESAVWVQRKINFTYQGFTTHYSCQGLEDTMRFLLRQLGARDSDMKLQQTGCAGGPNAPSPAPGVVGTFYVLEPASTAPGVAAPSDTAPENTQPNHDENTVKAQWQTVDVSISRGGRDGPGTCELIDLVHKRVVPLLPVRNVKFQSTCFPNTQLTKGSTLQAEVLKPVRGAHVASADE